MSARICFIYTTWPNKRSALAAAKKLLSERLIACANVLGETTSLYRWRGKLEQNSEVVMILKTRDRFFAQVERRVQTINPYETPCVVKIETPRANSAFADWIEAETNLESRL